MTPWVRELIVGALVGLSISILFGYWIWYLKGLIELQWEQSEDLKKRQDKMREQIYFLGDVIKFVDTENKRRAEEMDRRYIRKTPLIEEDNRLD
jgi:hypothetical protein